MRANFVRGRGDMMGIAGDLNDNASVPAPVESYWPNDYGLYCMAGNVNEWVQDVYRPMSFEDVESFRPFRGNVFETLERDASGNIVTKDSLGRLKSRQLDARDIPPTRRNFSKAYYKNYQDGDITSSFDYTRIQNEGISDTVDNSSNMYKSTGTDYNSLISDRARVYKGGSWRDKGYWLSPGTRRFLDERESRDDLGFRCAMTRVGSPAGN